ncbi:MarR family transcriptional regulator [Gallaecimonas kandeliae]|uniref:MarR family winged helix-turn-helix transcriptional regulator n=1 Tax=Gallaecimonas kandeliae TaxID=3029055 RepID=UPI00264A487A|nr:MarR family transcriptional regulator [Gallaecimonas kandeliae]WKE64851.1 MarR family transcriptional regulator [Gallaecimonas kandeliae]
MDNEKGRLFTQLVLATFKLSGLLVTEGDKLVKGLGLTSARWKVLGAVGQSLGGATVPDIARAMGQARQSVQRIVDAMAADGLLESRDNPQHKRARLFVLTEDGRQVLEKAGKLQEPWAAVLAAGLTEEELRLADQVLAKLIAGLEE